MSAKDDYVKNLEESVARLEAEKESIREEFNEKIKDSQELTAEDVKKARDILIPDALVTMKELLMIGESEQLRWSIAKFIISTKITDKGEEGENEFERLLSELTANGSKSNED
jgi:hypothetical protein